MRSYHSLKVVDKRREATDAVRIALEVPETLRDTFRFLPGQHLPLRIRHDGAELRRTYSICSAQGKWPLELGIRVQPGGAFSNYVAEELEVGDSIDAMPPFGQFHAGPQDRPGRSYAAFAAGSGITPILSIVATLLETEPDCSISLFYGNRRQTTTMFIDDLYALKNRYPGRLSLHFVFSREDQEFPIAAGRIDENKVRELWLAWCARRTPDAAFVCGPDTMIDSVCRTLADLGMPDEAIHSERFGVPRAPVRGDPVAASDAALITVIMDGHRKSFEMAPDDPNIVDAAAGQGIDLPYSCKGGVCATCRCRVVEGKVSMAVNYGLEPWEVEKGYVLACQSRPVTPELTLDYDTT